MIFARYVTLQHTATHCTHCNTLQHTYEPLAQDLYALSALLPHQDPPVHVCVFMCVFPCVCVCVCARVRVDEWVSECVCACVCVFEMYNIYADETLLVLHILTSVHIHTCVCVCVCVCAWMFVCVYHMETWKMATV